MGYGQKTLQKACKFAEIAFGILAGMLGTAIFGSFRHG
jgi:hypothetical protein